MAGLPSLTGPGFGIGVKDVGRRRLLEMDELLTRNGVPQMLGEGVFKNQVSSVGFLVLIFCKLIKFRVLVERSCCLSACWYYLLFIIIG